MKNFLTRKWIRYQVELLTEWANDLPLPWRVRHINDALYFRINHSGGRIEVRRRDDDLMILAMMIDDPHCDGDVHIFHMGLWEPKFAGQIGEALILLSRIHTEWNIYRRNGDEHPLSVLPVEPVPLRLGA